MSGLYTLFNIVVSILLLNDQIESFMAGQQIFFPVAENISLISGYIRSPDVKNEVIFASLALVFEMQHRLMHLIFRHSCGVISIVLFCSDY